MALSPSAQARVFDDASEAAQALVAFESGTEGFYQYELTAVFDNNRDVVGFQVRVKDLDGFGVGYVA